MKMVKRVKEIETQPRSRATWRTTQQYISAHGRDLQLDKMCAS